MGHSTAAQTNYSMVTWHSRVKFKPSTQGRCIHACNFFLIQPLELKLPYLAAWLNTWSWKIDVCFCEFSVWETMHQWLDCLCLLVEAFCSHIWLFVCVVVNVGSLRKSSGRSSSSICSSICKNEHDNGMSTLYWAYFQTLMSRLLGL